MCEHLAEKKKMRKRTIRGRGKERGESGGKGGGKCGGGLRGPKSRLSFWLIEEGGRR